LTYEKKKNSVSKGSASLTRKGGRKGQKRSATTLRNETKEKLESRIHRPEGKRSNKKKEIYLMNWRGARV